MGAAQKVRDFLVQPARPPDWALIPTPDLGDPGDTPYSRKVLPMVEFWRTVIDGVSR
jgi:hypothetical protein